MPRKTPGVVKDTRSCKLHIPQEEFMAWVPQAYFRPYCLLLDLKVLKIQLGNGGETLPRKQPRQLHAKHIITFNSMWVNQILASRLSVTDFVLSPTICSLNLLSTALSYQGYKDKLLPSPQSSDHKKQVNGGLWSSENFWFWKSIQRCLGRKKRYKL